MRPAFPGAASDSEDSLEHRDAAFDAGPETSQLPVHPTGAHHLIDLQPAFLGEGDVLDALLLGPLQIAAAGKASIAADLSRPTAVEIMLALEPGLKLISIIGVASHQLTIQHQAGAAAGQKQLVPKDRFPAPLFDDVGVLFKQRDHLLAGRNRLAPQDTTLGLIDDPFHQVPVVAQFSSYELTGKVRKPIRWLQGHLGVMSGLTSDLQQIPIGSLTTLASVVADIQATPLGAAPVIVKDDLVMSGQAAKPPGEDSNRVIQQLGIRRMADGALHGGGIGSNRASPFQSLLIRPLDQQPVDLLPGGGLDPADVLLQAGGTGGPGKGQTGEATKTLRVAPVESQLGVG